jgi:HlyD family secretion protein
MMHHIKRFAKRKSVIGLFSIVAVTGTVIGIQHNQAVEPTRYVLAAVTRGSIVTSVSASGQVSAENQLDVTPTVSGPITRIFAKLGQEVKTGTPLLQIDSKPALKTVRDARQNVRDAEISLAAAQISYEKLIGPQTGSALLQAQDALNQAERNLAKLQAGPDALAVMSAQAKVSTAEQNVKLAADGTTPKIVRDAYDKAVITLKSLVVTLQDALSDADDILAIDGEPANINFTNLFSALDQSKKSQANASYLLAKNDITAARDAVDPLQLRDESMSRIDAAMGTMEDALATTETLLKDVKAGLDASLTSAAFSQASLDQYKSAIQSDMNSVTNAYGAIPAQQDDIAAARETYINAQTSLAQARAELDKLMQGPDADAIAAAIETVAERKQALKDAGAGAEAIDVKTSLNVIEQRKSALQNARENLQTAFDTLNDYTVRAPFDGVIARMDAKTANNVSPSTVLATLLTKTKIAKVTLNEVDVSKVAVGQKATLTFDAVQNLTIAGTVSEVDMIGTASQGVVTYAVKISFLTDDDRIKSGMSVSASIVTDMRSDVLIVPNGAVHGTGNAASVSTLEGVPLDAASMSTGIPSAKLPQAKMITTGLANDQYTEITEGLKEGDAVVVRTIDAAAQARAKATATSAGSSPLRIQGLGGGGGFTGGGGGARGGGAGR